VRIPLADSTVVKAPAGVRDTALVLMADIWPTGFFAASNAFSTFSPAQIAASTVVVIGCGPVGLCALINAEEYKPKHLLAVDGVESRLELAKSLGAEPWNFQTQREGLDARVKELTEGRGADVVIEVVGLSPALKMGFELLRPWGVISSAGVHNGEVCLLVFFGFLLCCAHHPLLFWSPADIWAVDPMVGQPSVRQEPEDTDGTLSCSVHFPSGT
jgi:threonine dehydrogenase-like Zn-dependent dehydrogenase